MSEKTLELGGIKVGEKWNDEGRIVEVTGFSSGMFEPIPMIDVRRIEPWMNGANYRLHFRELKQRGKRIEE